MGKKETKKPITEDELKNLQLVICNISDQVAFLSLIFDGVHHAMEEHHFNGLSVMLDRVHDDAGKAFDIIADMEDRVAG